MDDRVDHRLNSAYDHLTPTIFHSSWWLDIVSRGAWEASKVFVDNELIAWLPYFPRRRLWFKESRMPVLTHFLGPAIKVGSGSDVTRLIQSLHVMRSLIQQIPPLSCFTQKMHRGVTDVVAFQMENFSTSSQFTFEIGPAPDDTLWRGMRDKTRNTIRAARKTTQIVSCLSAADLARSFDGNLQDRNERTAFDRAILIELIEACQARGCGRIYAALNGTRIEAAIFCAWDQACCYYLVSTRRLSSPSGAVAACLWEAIRDAAQAGLIFDFDGLGNKGAVRFYVGFGAKIQPRYTVSKLSHAVQVLRDGRRILRGQDNFFTDNN